MPSSAHITTILGTGGTIAGTASSATAQSGYTAATLGITQLLAAVPQLSGLPLQARQVAQLDSKDMSHAVWQQLVRAVADELARDEVSGVVVTHGTDTLEETAYLLQRVLAPGKPVVLTAAMRPATSLQADGPQNLLDAVTLARTPGVRGVLVLLAGRVHAGDQVRKVDAWRLDAFDSGDAGPLAWVRDGTVQQLRDWPRGEALGADITEVALSNWPRVAWFTSHAGFDPAVVDAAVAAGFDGLLLAGTGNGSLHADLLAAAMRAQAAGLVVRLSTRCASGRVVGAGPHALAISDAPGPAQARVALLLELLDQRAPQRLRERAAADTPSKPVSSTAHVAGSGTAAT
jgi:L-asparaginase